MARRRSNPHRNARRSRCEPSAGHFFGSLPPPALYCLGESRPAPDGDAAPGITPRNLPVREERLSGVTIARSITGTLLSLSLCGATPAGSPQIWLAPQAG